MILPLPKFQQTEKDITREIRGYLRSRGILHWKAWGGPMSEKGIPDILCCIKGRLIGIEVKGARGVVSPDQEKWIDRINRAGGLAFVAHSLDDVIRELEGR